MTLSIRARPRCCTIQQTAAKS